MEYGTPALGNYSEIVRVNIIRCTWEQLLQVRPEAGAAERDVGVMTECFVATSAVPLGSSFGHLLEVREVVGLPPASAHREAYIPVVDRRGRSPDLPRAVGALLPVATDRHQRLPAALPTAEEPAVHHRLVVPRGPAGGARVGARRYLCLIGGQASLMSWSRGGHQEAQGGLSVDDLVDRSAPSRGSSETSPDRRRARLWRTLRTLFGSGLAVGIGRAVDPAERGRIGDPRNEPQ